MAPPAGNTLPLPYAQVNSQPRREPRQPMRTSKLGTKLKVLPTQPDTPSIPEEEEEDDDEARARDFAERDEAEGVEFYTPLSQIPKGTARRDAQRLTKSEKAKLPRVTAYCTAASYNLPALQAHLSSRPDSYRTHPRMFDTGCLFTPYLPPPSASSSWRSPNLKPSTKHDAVPESDLIDLNGDEGPEAPSKARSSGPRRKTGFSKRPGGTRRAGDHADSDDEDFEEEVWVPDVFLFEYGTVVIWGMTEKEEKSFLRGLKKFEVERLSPEDVEMEDLNFYYADYSRIYNDVITLRKGSSYMTKLALSHALAQSVKISLFEELIGSTIDQTKDIPKTMSETGKIGLPRSEIMKQIGNLFILRININLVGSILDSPEFFWTFPDLEPLYTACRSYLEISQRIDLLNARVDVLQDMLKLLKESVNSTHGERLESIVIILIGIEIVLGIVTILVDLSLT
ncbi:cytoplasm protein [Kockovaella imperatae]|uniref:Cytoplasm protein n=1 Tax=Kockovaella imperatae TaxID=4999 RepID=A0A1Y1UTF3_9TREE|nr:cytoplasm protein [Kockovaella imperatae]ORX40897.1 cytoplasm protein [Kockovaella imperatae]